MKLFISALILLISSQVFAGRPAIYGEDDRVDTYVSQNPLFQSLAASSAALIHQDNLRIAGNSVELRGPDLGDAYKLCSDQRFRNQPTVATCSGVLVAPDVIATAGHCFESKDRCTRHKWVFNFKVEDENSGNVSVSRSDVYGCKEVIAQALDDKKQLDYALIRLDRRVTGVSPVKFSASPVEVGTPLVMIGHPSGLPQKISANAFIRSLRGNEFKANLDAFQINSGSGVFNSQTGELMGVLVRGVMDYSTIPGSGCNFAQKINNDSPGEDVSSWTQFAPFFRRF